MIENQNEPKARQVAWLLNGVSTAWQVTQGSVDIFAVKPRPDSPDGARHHLLRLASGQVFSGLGPAALDHGIRLLAVPLPAAVWHETGTINELLDAPDSDPSTGADLQTGVRQWLAQIQAGASELDRQTLALKSIDWPLIFKAALDRLAIELTASEQHEQQLLKAKKQADTRGFEQSLNLLSSLVQSKAHSAASVASGDAITQACQKVMQASGIKTRLKRPDAMVDGRALLESFASQAHVMFRVVALGGDEWHRSNSGPLLAFMKDSGEPVALLPAMESGYWLWRTDSQSPQRLSSKDASGLEAVAYMFFRSLPNHALGLKDLIRFAAWDSGLDLARIIGLGVLGGLLGMLTPYATGLLIDSVIPDAEVGQLMQLMLMLVAAAIGVSAFELTRSIGLLRLNSNIGNAAQTAVIHRLLFLPAPFFRKYSSGDLAQRAFGISGILNGISNLAQQALLSWVFCLFSYVYLFIIDWKLALAASGLVLISLLATLAMSLWRLPLERQMLQVAGDISGLVFQLLGGISKIRANGAEKRAFTLWAEKFSQQKQLDFKLSHGGNLLTSFNAGFAVISTMVLFTITAYWVPTMHPGSYIAFSSAFGQFFGATLGLTAALLGSLDILPTYERSKAVMEALPEINDDKGAPGDLTGAIDISHVTFRYLADGPTVLNDITLQIKAGEFVAFVGASGSGKSTLLRLLLGFEQLESGAIYYDGQDLSSLDITLVRRQLGVVLQNGQLMPGDIFTNIVGSAPLNMEDAMEAARMAGLDEDIKAMPMGLHTVIAEGAGTISGGQRQRLMIARALVKKPKILFFDEATSALDNQTQAQVGRSVEQLKASRVVIAHRLSTIVKADMIYVMEKGSIVEQGSYQQLMTLDGHFADLVRRQLV